MGRQIDGHDYVDSPSNDSRIYVTGKDLDFILPLQQQPH